MTLAKGSATEEIAIEICDYTEEMASDVAEMWNTWNELWPGGFTQGVPYTADRVQKQFGKSDALAILIAIDNETKKPLGSCTMYAHWRDTEAAYIGTLGVSPEVLGKKVGKKLLLESIERASENGYTRVDLNTWAGNMKAVPLYKKIGMMWNPEISGVHMEDFIPGILQHPLCSPFFVPLSGNHEWYNVHVRDPVQAPDDFEVEGLAIYPYEFKSDGNLLSVTVDRYGRGISGVERTIGGSKLRIRAKINSHQVLCGLPYTYTLEVENSTNDDLQFSVNLEAFDGMVFDEEHASSKTIAVGEKLEWNVPFHLDSSAPLYRDNIKAPTIVTQIEINGQKSELITGLKVRAAAEVKTRWGVSRIVAGGKTSIPLTIVSNLPKKSSAQIRLEKMDSPISVTTTENELKLDSEGFGGTVLQVSSDSNLKEGVHDIWVSLEIGSGKDQKITTRKFRVPVFCLGEKGVVVGHDDRRRGLVIASPIYDAVFRKEGAFLNAGNHYTVSGTSIEVRASIGPPFGINPFRFAERDPSITSLDNATVVSMKAKHPDKPLNIEDRATFEHRSGIILHEIWVTNTNNESETFQLRLNGRGGGISFNEGNMYVPLTSGVMREKLGNFYTGYPSIPSEPSGFAEGWIASEQEGIFTAQMWEPNEVEEVRVGHGQTSMISYPLVTLEPGETRRLSKIWLVFGAQSWQHVRRIWRSRVAGYFEDRVVSLKDEELKQLVNLESNPIIIPHLQDVESNISLTKSTLVPLNGRLRYIAPEGWTASISTTDIELETKEDGPVVSGQFQFTHDSTFELKVKPGSNVIDEFAIHRGFADFTSDWDVKKPIHIVQLGSKGSVEVLEDIDQDMKVFHVNNGLIEFTVSPDYGGCLISLKNKNNVEFLASSFPTPAPKPGGFFDNYYGGVQPIVFDDEMGEDISKAKTNTEKMSGKPIEVGFWKGVEVNWVGKLQKLSRGVDFKLRYLTSSKSPLVLIQWVIFNKTNAPMKFWPTFLIDPNLSNQLSGGSFLTVWDDDDVSLKKGMVPVAVIPTKSVVWMKPNEDQKETSGFSFMMAGEQSRLLAASLGEIMLLGGVDYMTLLMPKEKKVITAALLVDPKNSDDVRDLQEVLDKI
jgi:ribosomal protein S18 acetylase RimI-like enzyme